MPNMQVYSEHSSTIVLLLLLNVVLHVIFVLCCCTSDKYIRMHTHGRRDLQSQHLSQEHWGAPTFSLNQELKTSGRLVSESKSKKRRRRERSELFDLLVIEADPRAQTPGPRGGAAETVSPAAQPETTLHTVTMVIIRWNHRDYNSSGIGCKIYMNVWKHTRLQSE